MKPDLTAVEAYEFLPDPDLWAHTYDIFRFAERPGERSLEVTLSLGNVAGCLFLIKSV